MIANIYIDGFNLYYGSLKSRYRQYKWLDLQSLSESLLPGRQVRRVRYFTARVKSSPCAVNVSACPSILHRPRKEFALRP